MRVLRFSGGAVVCSLLVAAVVAGTWFALTFAARDVRDPALPADAAVSLPPAATVGPMPNPPGSPGRSTPTATTPSTSRSPHASAGPSDRSSPGPSNRSMFLSDYGDAAVHCAAMRVVYFSVHPEPGWLAATRPISPSVLEITFTDPDRYVLVVRATCGSSGPRFDPSGASATPSPAASPAA